MKVLFLGLLAVAVLGNANVSKADVHPEHGYKYHTTYAQWDAGFGGYYGYRESACDTTINAYGLVNTCYRMAPSDNVYIVEQQESSGYHRVNVYSDEAGTQTVATYYVYEDTTVKRVERRDFYDGRVSMQTTYYQTDYTIWNMCEWQQGWDNLYVGALTIDIGAAVLAGAGDTPAGAILGLGSMALGSSSVSKGEQQIQESSLETSISQTTYSNGTAVR
jgi:hypothetical protein